MILTASQNAPNFQFSRPPIAGNSGLTKYSARTESSVVFENQSKLIFSSSLSNESLAGGFTDARNSSEVIVRC